MADFKLNYTGAQINTLLEKVNGISSFTGTQINTILGNANSWLTSTGLKNNITVGPNIKLPSGETTLGLFTSDGSAINLKSGRLGLGDSYTALDLTNYRFHCNGNALLVGETTHYDRIYYPHNTALPCLENLAYYNSDADTVTGTIKITLPTTSGKVVMQMMEVWVYNYNAQSGSQLIISGYTYSDNKWYNYNCKIQGSYSNGCRLAYDGTHHCVLLGTTSTHWAYPKVWFKTWMGGYGHKMDWVNGGAPTISVITSESGYTITGTAS